MNTVNALPITGRIPISYTVKESFRNKDQYDDLFAEIDSKEMRIDIFPPRPLEFTKDNYKPLHRDIDPMTVGELYCKIQSAPADSLLVILEYDRFSKKFNVKPQEVISYIDYYKDENELGLYSVYREDGKMIECSQLQSVFTNNDGKVSLLKRLHNKVITVPEKSPLYLFSKLEGKQPITDIIAFRASAMISEKNYIGIVVEEEYFIPDFENEEEE